MNSLIPLCLLLLSQLAYAVTPPRIWPGRRYAPITSFNLDEKDIRNRNVRIAAREDDVETMNEAIEAGGLIDSQSDQGVTAVIYASKYCKTRSLRALIERGADVNLADHRGRTALMLAADAPCLDAVKILLKSGIDVRAKDKNGRTAIDYAEGAASLEFGGQALQILRMIRTRSRGLGNAQR